MFPFCLISLVPVEQLGPLFSFQMEERGEYHMHLDRRSNTGPSVYIKVSYSILRTPYIYEIATPKMVLFEALPFFVILILS